MLPNRINWWQRKGFAQSAVFIGAGLLFVWAGCSKLMGYDEIVSSTDTLLSSWVSGSKTRLLSVAAVEVTLAMLLLTGIQRNLSGILAILILSAFTGLLLAEARKPSPKECGCFGRDFNAKLTTPGNLYRSATRNVALIAVLAAVLGSAGMRPVTRRTIIPLQKFGRSEADEAGRMDSA